MNKKIAILIFSLVLLLFFATGCQQSQPVVFGLVDMQKIIKDDSEYQRLSTEYMKESNRGKQDMVLKLKDANEEQRKKLMTEYSQVEDEFNKRWLKATNEFFSTKREEISEIVGEIAQRKNIDIVLVDGKDSMTVEWGGVDITQDVMVKILAETEDSVHSSAPQQKSEEGAKAHESVPAPQ